MIVISTTSNLDREEMLDQAKATFGEGLGLVLEHEDTCCITFNDPNTVGYVSLHITSDEGEPSKIKLETREYKFQVEQFMKQVS